MIYQILSVVCSVLIALSLYKLICARIKFLDLPKPPHNLLFGHLPLLLREWKSYSGDMSPAYILDGIREKFSLPRIFFLDFYPIFSPVVVISDPEVARRITVEDKSPRWPSVFDVLRPVGTEGWINTLSEKNWARDHSVFGKSFTTSQFIQMVPHMSEDLDMLAQTLSRYSKTKQVFKMDNLAKSVILAITGRVIFARQIDTFSENSEWINKYDRTISMIPQARNPLTKPFIMKEWRERCSVFHTLIRNEILACFRERDSTSRPKPSLLHSSFTAYLENKLPSFPPMTESSEELSDGYLENLVGSCVGALLAATSGSMALDYCFMLLNQYPDIAQRVREEHARVFSPERDATLQLLKTNPEWLNNLEFTLAVLKETLRIFSMGIVLRQPSRDNVIYHDGHEYPIGDHIVVLFHTAMHRQPDFFPDPNKFDPNRFMPGSRHKILPDTWRPFEKGRGSCTGKELALIQLKLVLLLTVRDYDFELAYNSKASKGPDVYGGLAYPTLSGTGPGPADRLPIVAVRRKPFGENM